MRAREFVSARAPELVSRPPLQVRQASLLDALRAGLDPFCRVEVSAVDTQREEGEFNFKNLTLTPTMRHSSEYEGGICFVHATRL